MDLKGLIESLATGWADRLTILVPLALIGLVGLYVVYLLIGYLHASNRGIEAEAVSGEAVMADAGATGTAPRQPGGRRTAWGWPRPSRRSGRPRAMPGGPGLRMHDLRDDHWAVDAVCYQC